MKEIYSLIFLILLTTHLGGISTLPEDWQKLKKLKSEGIQIAQEGGETRGEQFSPPDELVEFKLNKGSDGLELDFVSHGRHHKLLLHESKQNLNEISLTFLGMSQSDTNKVKERIKHVKLMKDTKHGATVAVDYTKRDKAEPILQGGVFRLGLHEFHVKLHNVSKHKAMVSKRAIPDKINYGNDGVKVELQRKRRQVDQITPISAEVELVMLADYSVWKYIEQREIRGKGASDYMTNLLLYLAHMNVIIDSHYSTMQNDDIAISVKLAGIVAITDPTILPELTEEYSIYQADSGDTYINGDSALSRLTDWLKTNKAADILPPNDHVMLLTAYDMFIEFDGHNLTSGLLVSGLAWLGTICDPGYSSSFVEMRSLLTFNALTAAHELGHSLGSNHDSADGNSESCPDDNYVMGAVGEIANLLPNKFLFSCCSQRSFYGTISEVECLSQTSAAPNYPDNIAESIAQLLPGQVYDADDQCYMFTGTEACYDEYYAEQGIEMCLNLYCALPNQPGQCISQYIAPADGTKCGDNRWCYRGECVPENTVYQTLDQNCNVRDCYGNETRCEAGMSRTPLVNCYRQSQRCDRVEQCFDGSDELGCPEFFCPKDFTQCTTGTSRWSIKGVPIVCIPDKWICDDFRDCFDNSDEEDLCHSTTLLRSTSASKPTTKKSTLKPTTKTSTLKPKPKSSSLKFTTRISTTNPTINLSTHKPTAIASSSKTSTTPVTAAISSTASKATLDLSAATASLSAISPTSSTMKRVRKLRFNVSLRIIGFQSMNFSCDNPDLQVPGSVAFKKFWSAVCEGIQRHVKKTTCLTMETRCGSIIADVVLEIEKRDGEEPESAGPENSAALREDIRGILSDPEIIVVDMPVVEDFNECEDPRLNNCSVNSVCTNTDGYYTCACNEEYQVDLSEYRDEQGQICAKPCPADLCREVEKCEAQPESDPLCVCKEGEFCETWMWELLVGVLGGIALLVIIIIIIGGVCGWRKRNKTPKQGVANDAYGY